MNMHDRPSMIYPSLAVLLVLSVLILSNVPADGKIAGNKKEVQKGFMGSDTGMVVRMKPVKSEYLTVPATTRDKTRAPGVSPQGVGPGAKYYQTERTKSIIASNKNIVGVDEKNIRLISADYDEQAYENQKSGTSYVFYEQTHNGIPVYGSYVGLISIDGEDVLLKS